MLRFLVLSLLFHLSVAFILKDENNVTNRTVQYAYDFLDFSNSGLSAGDCCEHGRCVRDNRGKQKCLCKPGYALQGDFSCAECYCGEKDKCFFVKDGISEDGTLLYEKKCMCNDGYAEKYGLCIDCVCGNHSKCEFEGESKVCYCVDGYAEIFKKCEKCHCGDNGESCEFRDNQKVCECFEDYAFDGEVCRECDCGANSAGCKFHANEKICFCKEGFSYKSALCRETCSSTKQCRNGGNCTNRENGRFCECPRGTEGDLCQVVIGCRDDPDKCTPGGICTYSRESQVAKCICEDSSLSYDDHTRTCKRSCNQYSCGNGGECIQQLYGSFCHCQNGTSGDFCEVVDECVGNRLKSKCPENTVCVFNVNLKKASCMCKNEKLKFDEMTWKCRRSCSSAEVCHHGALCDEFCRCPAGVSGDMCEIVEECRTKFVNCTGTKGRCIYNDDDGAHCKCDEGMAYNEDSGNCKACECGIHSTGCQFNGSRKKNCICNAGFSSVDGICRESCNKDNVCQNGGKCTQYEFGNLCHCPSGIDGDLCQIVVACRDGPNKCSPGGICAYDQEKFEATCKCADPKLQYDEMTGKCRKGCEEQSSSCQNNGICKKQSYGSFCFCSKGTSGDNCEVVDECSGNHLTCPTEAPCRYDSSRKKGRCMCRNSELEFDNIIKSCRKVCNESEDECKSGSKCVYSYGSEEPYGSFCRCYDGTYGDRCEIIEDCVTNRIDCPTDSYCGYDAKTQKPGCLCSASNTEFDKATQRCREICIEDSDCHHDSRCDLDHDNDHGFCDCPNGLSGDRCEIINDCESRLRNCRGENGTCRYQDGKAICDCREGKEFDSYNGFCKDCDCGDNSFCSFVQRVKACDCLPKYSMLSGTCQECDCGHHSEECLFKKNVKTCSCLKGFEQNDGVCQECDCGQNSASCKFEDGIKKCNCYSGYVEENGFCERKCMDIDCIGGHCEVIAGIEECICPEGLSDVDGECEEVLCRPDTCYGGTCKNDKFGKFTCVCPPGFHLEGIGCIETQCERQNCYGGKCRVIDDHELCTCLEGYTLKDDACERIPCKEKKCIGGKCDVIEGIERCTCPKGLEIDGDICRNSKKTFRGFHVISRDQENRMFATV